MKFKETLEKIGVGDDDKARRVLNVSNAKANITADELEAGVTIERLAEIGVPVLRYSTQVTIHGDLPDFDPASRPAGYASVFKNANGSVGVRYVAIDGEKKRRIVEASRLSVSPEGTNPFSYGWTASIDSQGLGLAHYFEDKQACIDAYRAFPRDLIFGSVAAMSGAFGGYYVFVHVGAVLEENIWKLTNILWKVESAACLQQLRDAAEARRAQAESDRRASIASRAAEIAETRAAFASEFAKTHERLTEAPKPGMTFIRISASGGSGIPWIYTIAKRGPSTCYLAEPYTNQKAPEVVGKKWNRLEAAKQQAFEKDIAGGLLFKVAS